MRRSLRALAALLSYPSAELQAALPEIRAALAADATLAPALPQLDRLVGDLGAGLLDLQEDYVGLFDRSRGLCLNLFEHVHGDSRERGPAMVELNGIYQAAGLLPTAGELPDHLPMLLEYAAIDPEHGAGLLANAAPVLDLLHGRLAARSSAYAAVLRAALLVAGHAAGAVPATPEPEQTADELDAAWAEAPVVFGPGADPAAECGSDALAAKLRAAARSRSPVPQRQTVFRHAASSQG
jgi:nitrate reductase delta subunit